MKMNWIKLTETCRPPKDVEWVIVYGQWWENGIQRVGCACYDNNTFYFDSDYEGEWVNVTHWMALPAPPVTHETEVDVKGRTITFKAFLKDNAYDREMQAFRAILKDREDAIERAGWSDDAPVYKSEKKPEKPERMGKTYTDAAEKAGETVQEWFRRVMRP